MNDRLLIIVVLCLYIGACAPTKTFTKQDEKRIDKILEMPPFDNHFTGLGIWDASKEKWLYRRNVNKLFIPASNIKLLTLFSTIELLGDSIPLFEYYREDNVLHIRGNGNPALLHPDFSSYQPDWNHKLNLQSIDSIIIHKREMKNSRYGPGWSWDDYSYHFQAEVSAFPLYGNSLWATWDSSKNTIHFTPEYVAQFADIDIVDQTTGISIKREEFANQFIVSFNPSLKDSSVQSAPYFVDDYVQSRILRDTFGLPVKYSYAKTSIKWKGFHNIPLDTIIRKMMLESDNFIAEQLLLMASGNISQTLSSSKAIEHILINHFSAKKDNIKWVDGSGLSRYNLLSPEFIIELLKNLQTRLSADEISYFFPIAGHTGTIKNWPIAPDHAYILAKSGELKNTYNISGYLKTDGGRVLCFSFMNNNYLDNPSQIKLFIQKVLKSLKQSY